MQPQRISPVDLAKLQETSWDPDYMNVLCEGPSVLRVLPEDLLPGPTVAINQALRLSRRFEILSWSLQDDPIKKTVRFGLEGEHSLWDRVKDYQPEGFFNIWSKPKHIDALASLPGLRPGTRIECGLPAIDATFPFKVKQHPVGLRSGFTIFQTLAHAIIRRARHIRVFGADMKGMGSVFTRWVPEEDEAWRVRWDEERKRQWPNAMKECELHGIKVERWVPPEDREAVPL